MIQDWNPRIAQASASNRRSLLLTTAERDPALPDNSVIFRWKSFDVTIEARDLRCLHHASLIVLRKPERDISTDRVAEEIRILRNIADGSSQRLEWPFTDCLATAQNFTLGSMPHPLPKGPDHPPPPARPSHHGH